MTSLRCAAILLSLACISFADDWPQLRGPTGDGLSTAKNVPLTWSETENIKWKVAIPGRGRSSPVIQGDRIWLTTAVETKPRQAHRGPDPVIEADRVAFGAVCLERATGKLIFHKELFAQDNPQVVHALNSFATPTPVIEGDRLYCDFGTFGTACIDASNGNLVWQKQLPLDHQVGPGSSPIIYKELMILVRDGRDQQYVTALNKKTGEEAWKTKRPPIKTGDGALKKSFCTPLVINADGRDQMVVAGAQWVVSYDPATGQEIWRVNTSGGFSVAPRPVFGNGLVYVCTGASKPELYAIRPDAEGDLTKSNVVWRTNAQIPLMPSPILVGKDIYIVSDSGIINCYDATDGLPQGRLRAANQFGASPVYADGRIYFFGMEGATTVIKATKDLDKIAENRLPGTVFASPAILSDGIFLRTDTHLYCIGKK